MDIDLENRVNETIEQLRQLAVEDINFNEMDPIAKMLLVAMLNESQKIIDHIDTACQRIVERYCTHFIPHDQASAIPAIAILAPKFKSRKDAGAFNIGSGAIFSYKTPSSKHPLNYIPFLSITAIPHSRVFTLSHTCMSTDDDKMPLHMEHPGRLWLGIVTPAEVDNLKGLSLLIQGTRGILPERISVGTDGTQLDFATMREIENMEMAAPFDAQQSSGLYFSIINAWKQRLLNMNDASLIYITDDRTDRDLFKPRAFPNSFKQELEDSELARFEPNTLWLCIDFPQGVTIPDSRKVTVNALPVVNVDLNTLTLTQASPIAKLQRQDNAFFLSVVETSSAAMRQGFNPMDQDIIIRDFDAGRYSNGDLYRDVRNLYNRFIDDYYAFIEYNGIKDGEALRRLRQTINQIGKSVGERNSKFDFDSGTYVMKNMNQEQSSSTVRVTYLTTQGSMGNDPKAGEIMDSKKLPAIDPRVPIVVAAMGGTDKASADQRYELLRYYTLTNDRLYTRMDIDAFLRKEIMAEFGMEEFRRIFIKTSIEGAPGPTSLQRGLHIDIEFKDRKNFNKARDIALGRQLLQHIQDKSCIAMPIYLQLKNLENNETAQA